MSYIALEESAYGVSFFERLEAGSSLRSVTQGPDPSDVLESIKRNVSNLLNTRLGEAQSAPSLGLIDFNDATLGSNDLAVQIKFAIRHCLEKYEPRLSCMEIRVVSDLNSPLNLRFQIEAKISSKALHESVQIQLLLDNSRKYRVF